jgi:hypothetical protein
LIAIIGCLAEAFVDDHYNYWSAECPKIQKFTHQGWQIIVDSRPSMVF